MTELSKKALERPDAAATEAELRREWGSNYDRHMDLANRAIRVFGGPEAVRALIETGAGRHPAIVRAFARIGAALAEDVPPPSHARQEIERLKADPEFQAAFLNRMHPGHDAAVAKMLRLQTQAAGES